MAINTLRTDALRIAALLDSKVDNFVVDFDAAIKAKGGTPPASVMGKVVKALDTPELAAGCAWQPDDRVTREVLRRKREFDKEFPDLENKLLALLDDNERAIYKEIRSRLHGARRPKLAPIDASHETGESAPISVHLPDAALAGAFKPEHEKPLFNWAMTKNIWEDIFREDGIDWELRRLTGYCATNENDDRLITWKNEHEDLAEELNAEHVRDMCKNGSTSFLFFYLSDHLSKKPGNAWDEETPVDQREKSASYLFRKIERILPYVLSTERELEDVTSPGDNYYLKAYVPESMDMPEIYGDAYPAYWKQSNPKARLIEKILQKSISEADRPHITIETNRDVEGRYFDVTWNGVKARLPDQGYFKNMAASIEANAKAIMPPFEMTIDNDGGPAAVTLNATVFPVLRDLSYQMGFERSAKNGAVFAMMGEERCAPYDYGIATFADLQNRELEQRAVEQSANGKQSSIEDLTNERPNLIRCFVAGEKAISELLEGYLGVTVKDRVCVPPQPKK